ncbi:MAG TPA: hypothetical protein PK620_01555 [Denitromonas sp.]|uniref:hypothetical protein n=1 Tax=Denitromonas sp. TaxID=2734609 RepID=UPI001D5A0191|nr:hypothetical protein [Rhodocyclaceae bacterium]MCP5221900.1 hypothetical protein [Zoogloeaceae bacterium]HPR06191.1 hypothetical protein [Denitromonas sp.]HQU89822.1 hypothetical protein [Denitromonas sp.]HQV13572.1 hypothetical protein [Denitromonas sp.]
MPDPTPSTAQDPQSRYLRRVERRLKVLETLDQAGLGIFLSSDSQQRKHHIELFARLIARQSELPRLNRSTFEQATKLLEQRLEAMQKHLPSDVQHRNRIRRNW